ncbi:MAG: dihydrolipoyl dehydrogenase [Dehalococcoidia bacterium]|nr:dihydrolipoyl dehydrogenase [Dehalococcoidia bacterium]
MATYDVGIIGGGPGGYVAAIRAAQLGLRVVLFEKDRVGGLCLNWGCIPSKALLKNADVVNLVRDAHRWGISARDVAYDLGAAIDRSRKVVDTLVGNVEVLVRQNGIEIVNEAAALDGPNAITAGGQRYEVANIIVATGAATRSFPNMQPDGRVVITSREALVLRQTPPRAVVIGAGPVGVEFAHLWATYGSHVTVIEMLDTLVPLEDPDIGRQLKRSFEARGMSCLTGTKVESVTVKGKAAKVAVSQGGEQKEIEADIVLVAVGFVPHTEGLNLDSAGVALERGYIAIDDHMRTNVPNVYAIGDITGKLLLAHVAMAQGTLVAEHIAGKQVPALDYVQIPRATFCQPQIGSIGYTEAQAKAAGFTTKVGRFPLSAIGKSIATGETEGFLKVVADDHTGQVLGIHMIGHDVVELLGEATMVSLLEATTIELGFAVHTHPTLGEALKEAALAADAEAIHIMRRRSARPAPEGAAAR